MFSIHRHRHRHELRPDLVHYLVLSGLLLGSVASHADRTYWQPRAQLGVGYDDNVRLAYDGQDIEDSGVYQGQLDGEIGVEAGTSKTTLFGRYWSQAVDANRDYNADIKQLRWGFLNGSERSQLTMNLDAQYDTTLTSEFEESGLSLNKKKDRHYFRGKLGYRWQLSELDYLTGDFGADSVRYIDAENVGLNDYDTSSITLGYGRSLSEMISAGLQAVYSEFEIPQALAGVGVNRKSETDNAILLFFGNYHISDVDQFNLQAGFRKTNIYDEYVVEGIGSLGTSKEQGNGQVYSLGYMRKFDISSLQVSASRDLRPNGSGAVYVQDSVGISAQFNLSELLTLTTSSSVNRLREPTTRSVLGTSASEDITYRRDFAQILVGLRYSVDEENILAIEFNGRKQRLGIDDTIDADSAAIYLRWYWNSRQRSL